VEVGGSFGGNAVALMTLDPISTGTRLTYDMHFEADDLAWMKAHIDEAMTAMAKAVVDRFGGRLVERYVEP
jgi:hypothetical protein